MKYEALEEPTYGRWWCVRDHEVTRRYRVLTGFTEAEAHIIVFALNAVAEGHALHYDKLSNGVAIAHVMYDGPTEGVAPHG